MLLCADVCPASEPTHRRCCGLSLGYDSHLKKSSVTVVTVSHLSIHVHSREQVFNDSLKSKTRTIAIRIRHQHTTTNDSIVRLLVPEERGGRVRDIDL